MNKVEKQLVMERFMLQGVSRNLVFSEFYMGGILLGRTPGDYTRPTIKLSGKVYMIEEGIKN